MDTAFKEFNVLPKCHREDCAIDVHDFSEETLKLVTSRRAIASLRIAKAIFIGDASVGKTSLVMRYAHNAFDMNYKATIGVDFEVEKYAIMGVPFTLQMWDTAGSERFQCIASSYYRGANSVIICFDYTRLTTLRTVEKWLDQAIAENPKKTFLLFLVGLKRDLVNDKTALEVEEEAVEVAKNINSEFWSVSAASSYNVEELFSRIACLTFNDILTRDGNNKYEKKVISPVAVPGTRKITVDNDFYAKTRDVDHSCAFSNCQTS